MPLAGGGFSGDMSLNIYSLKFTNASNVERVFNQAKLETLFNGCTTWISSTPSTLPATTFSGDIAVGVNGISYTNCSLSLGILTVAYGVYSAVTNISTMTSYMRLTEAQTLTGNLSFSSDTFHFFRC